MKVNSQFLWTTKNSQVQGNKKAVEIQKSEYLEILDPSDLKFRPIMPHKLTQQSNRHFTTTISKQSATLVMISTPQKTDLNILMVTFVVTNLYSNIPYELGKQGNYFG